MIAYYVYDATTKKDTIILPEMGCQVNVNSERFQDFISVDPVFAKWSGNTCGDLNPEDLGTVLATRQEGGDVCVINERLWQDRMDHYLAHKR